MKYPILLAIVIVLLSGCHSTQNLRSAPLPETTSLDSVLKLVTAD